MPDEKTKRTLLRPSINSGLRTGKVMEEHDLDKEDAEKVQEIMEEEGIDEDEAVELVELL